MVIKRTEVTEPIEWTVKYFVETLGVRLEEAEFIIASHKKYLPFQFQVPIVEPHPPSFQ